MTPDGDTSLQLGSGFLIQRPSLHQREEVAGSRWHKGGAQVRAPPFLFSNPTFRPPALPCCLDCDPSKRSASFPMSRCGGEQTDHLHGQPGRCWPLAGSFQGSRQLRRVLFFAVFFLPVTTAPVESLANDPGEWRLLSRVQVNPPGVQAFVETFFSHNQLKAGPVGDLVLGFAAVPQRIERTQTSSCLASSARRIAGIHPFRSPTAMISRGQPPSGSTAIRVRSTSLGSAIRGKSREGREVNSGSATGDRRMEEPLGFRHGISPSGRRLRGGRS